MTVLCENTFTTFLKSKIITVGMRFELSIQWRFVFKKGVNNFFSNQFGISGLPETYITADKLYGAILGFFQLLF